MTEEVLTGRPPRDERVRRWTVHMDRELVAEIQRAATADGVTYSHWVETAARGRLDRR